MNEHQATADGLRQLANWLEQHPELTLPSIDIKAFPVDEEEPPSLWIRALGGRVEKDYSEPDYGLFWLHRDFGAVRLSVVYDRAAVCRKIIKGTETVTLPAVEAQPERTEQREIVEWVCDQPLLKEVSA